MIQTRWKITSQLYKKSYSHKEWFCTYFTLLQVGLFGLKGPTQLALVAWRLLRTSSSARIGWSLKGTRLRNKSPLNPLQLFKKNQIKHQLKPAHMSTTQYSNPDVLFQSFLTHWQLSRPKAMYDYFVHRDFRLLFLHTDSHGVHSALISANKYFKRWVDSYNLLFNLFYAEPSVQMLSNKLFIEESLVFNWSHSKKNYKLFKYTQPWFIFKDAPHGGYIHLVMRFLVDQNVDFLLLIDIHNHNKMLSYLQKYNFYIIGLIPVSRAPWRVSYPIPMFADSQLSQFYFLRWLFL